MGIFGKKDKSTALTPERPPTLSPADLVNAKALMDRWDQSMGNNSAMWSCLEAIAQLGGFRGMQAALMEVVEGKDAGDVTNRPWRWWTEASRAALEAGDYVLPGKIFLFSYLFTSQILPTMNAATQVDVGLSGPSGTTYQSIAHQAILALGNLPPSTLIHDTRTGQVDVASALTLAHKVTGTTPPPPSQPAPAPSSPADSSPWNSL